MSLILTLDFVIFKFQIIKALNLYRKKTGTDNYFWVNAHLLSQSLNFSKYVYIHGALSQCPSQHCLQIHLDKKVPTGAGLGGGSSNAATALWAANHFSGGLATEKELQEWSGEIGSDVPFFFSQGAAYCTGRGEVCITIFQDSLAKYASFLSINY